MPKRKRDDDDSDEDDQSLRIRKARFRVKVEQGNKSIASALKLARGFERQKLGRRQKTAKAEPKELLRLKEEVITLKSLDLGETAQKYLFKQLAKTKRIKESATFIAIYGEEPNVVPPKPGAEANVMARLSNSNPVKEALPGVMKSIFSCLGLKDAPSVKKPAKSALVEKDSQKVRTAKTASTTEDDFEGFSSEGQENQSPTQIELNHDHLDDLEDVDTANYDDRLASDSRSDSESVSSGIFQTLAISTNGIKHNQNPTDEVSLSPSTSPPPAKKPKGVLKAKEPEPLRAAKTTFLPSLMMGGYYSGSDSDDGGVELDRKPAPQRKNRRGQKARQAIAEKKHGKNANHIKNGQTSSNRDVGWDARKGATDKKDSRGRDAKGGDRRFGKRPRNDGKPTGANDEAVAGRREKRLKGEVKSEGPLHPSWEAARKRKEQGQGTTQAFVGKKITFD